MPSHSFGLQLYGYLFASWKETSLISYSLHKFQSWLVHDSFVPKSVESLVRLHVTPCRLPMGPSGSFSDVSPLISHSLIAVWMPWGEQSLIFAVQSKFKLKKGRWKKIWVSTGYILSVETVPTGCILSVGTVSTGCILSVGTVPTECILSVGTSDVKVYWILS